MKLLCQLSFAELRFDSWDLKLHLTRLLKTSDIVGSHEIGNCIIDIIGLLHLNCSPHDYQIAPKTIGPVLSQMAPPSGHLTVIKIPFGSGANPLSLPSLNILALSKMI